MPLQGEVIVVKKEDANGEAEILGTIGCNGEALKGRKVAKLTMGKKGLLHIKGLSVSAFTGWWRLQ